MSYGRKGKTNAAQVAIRDVPSATGSVLTRVPNNSYIEVSQSTVPSNDSNSWYKVAYGYKKVGYMMTNFVNIVSSTANKYYMIETLEAFGNDNYQKGIRIWKLLVGLSIIFRWH